MESSLPDQLHNHFCAEVVSGTIKSKQDAIERVHKQMLTFAPVVAAAFADGLRVVTAT